MIGYLLILTMILMWNGLIMFQLEYTRRIFSIELATNHELHICYCEISNSVNEFYYNIYKFRQIRINKYGFVMIVCPFQLAKYYWIFVMCITMNSWVTYIFFKSIQKEFIGRFRLKMQVWYTWWILAIFSQWIGELSNFHAMWSTISVHSDKRRWIEDNITVFGRIIFPFSIVTFKNKMENFDLFNFIGLEYIYIDIAWNQNCLCLKLTWKLNWCKNRSVRCSSKVHKHFVKIKHSPGYILTGAQKGFSRLLESRRWKSICLHHFRNKACANGQLIS